ncbi:TIM protein, partial [Odontophorus gujanensis]|nr:TIM protein [Odontophorus gujanensis]
NKKAFVELLFWKNATAVREMSEGYGSLQDGEGAGARRTPAWNPQEEQALRELFWKYKEAEGMEAVQGGVWTPLASPPTAPTPAGQDVIASILTELPGRTRRQVVQQLVRM